MAAVTITVPGWLQLSVGAGIYEELVFRLMAFTLLSLLFVDLLGMKRFWAYLLMVLTSSLAFSLYHYWGNEPFVMRTFAFRTFAGVFFGAVFAFRGFGVSAGTHASYDILINLLQSLSR
jgi:membrane protease YdiL (CAAX protease family)